MDTQLTKLEVYDVISEFAHDLVEGCSIGSYDVNGLQSIYM